jgi:hypothetical protein
VEAVATSLHTQATKVHGLVEAVATSLHTQATKVHGLVATVIISHLLRLQRCIDW